jgi:ABC-2 type transport system ATP-binding protein
MFGRGLHVGAEDGEAVAARIRALLDERGFAAAHVEKIVPTLEDVFVSLIEAHDREESAEAEVRR